MPSPLVVDPKVEIGHDGDVSHHSDDDVKAAERKAGRKKVRGRRAGGRARPRQTDAAASSGSSDHQQRAPQTESGDSSTSSSESETMWLSSEQVEDTSSQRHMWRISNRGCSIGRRERKMRLAAKRAAKAGNGSTANDTCSSLGAHAPGAGANGSSLGARMNGHASPSATTGATNGDAMCVDDLHGTDEPGVEGMHAPASSTVMVGSGTI
eukprot:jgi/Mesvir1/22589/Mv05010-RA.1